MGAHIIQENFENLDMAKRDQVTASTKIDVLGLLKQHVRPEFLNRIDEIIMFTPLDKNEVKKIVALQLQGLTKLLTEKGISMTYTDEALESISNQGFDPQFGARPIKRVIQRKVLNELSKEILSGKINIESNILLDAFDDELVFRKK